MPTYIEREALLKESHMEGAYGYVSDYEIAHFPSADVAPVRHGEWIQHIEQDLDWVKYEQECSVCKERIRGIYGTCYCPNCGADMRKR